MRIRITARSAVSWNTFREHCILEYEIPKWDGDIGQPNLYVPVSEAALQRKIDLLMAHFGSQRSKQWFDEETFRGLARIRGMECRAPERYAEAFFGRKLVLVCNAANMALIRALVPTDDCRSGVNRI